MSGGTVLPVRRRSARYPIVLDPLLSRRGEVDVEGGRIVLREWDEEVLLHECLHALLHEGEFLTVAGYGTSPTRVASGEEETLVQHLSHGLFEMGWRLAADHAECEQPDGCTPKNAS